MATISSIARNNYMMLKYAQKSGKSLFDSSTYSARNSSFFSSYTSTGNDAASTMSGLYGIRSSMRDMVNSYNTAAKTFRAEFSGTMDDLVQASDSLKKMNFDVGGKAALTETVGEDGKTIVTKSKDLTDVLKGIEKFADKYNEAIDFFNDNADLTKHMKNMTAVFSDTTYRAGSLATIGVVVDNEGKMKLDEDALVKTLTENPTKVERLLGKGGLAAKADSHISFARSQQSRLFPSASSVLGSSIKQSSVYSGNSLLRLSSYSSVGSLLNMWI